MVKRPDFRKPVYGKDRYWRPLPAPPSCVIGRSVAVSDSEILIVAHHLPIVVSVSARETTVHAQTDSRVLLRKAFDDRSHVFLRGYTPLRLRALPFHLAGADTGLEIMVDQLADTAADGRPIFSEDGAFDPTVERVRDTLARCQAGSQRLTVAANQLFAAGLLAELPALADEAAGVRCYTADPEALQGLGQMQLVGLASNGFLTMDLIASLIFSVRHLRPAVRMPPRRHTSIGPVPLTAEAIDRLVREAGRIELELDDGQMIYADLLGDHPMDDL